jgi:predicted nucleic acid-binding protein
MAYVIDPSVALAWLLPDESNPRAIVFRTALENGARAWIPSHWLLEVSNGLLMAERRRRISAGQVAQALSLVSSLPLEGDEETSAQMSVRIFPLARKHGLTIYDAAYLELAQRRGAILASFDEQLLAAAAREKVAIE